MNIFFDTNILIDIYCKRNDFFEKSFLVFSESLKRGNQCFISAKSIIDLYYFLKKTVSQNKCNKIIGEIMSITNVVDVIKSDLMDGYRAGGRDFEDNVLLASACRIKADCIITRNQKDFSGTYIEIMTPDEYLEKTSKNYLRVQETAVHNYSVDVE